MEGAPTKPLASNLQIATGRRLTLPVLIRNHALNASPRRHVLPTVQIVRGRIRTRSVQIPMARHVDRARAQAHQRYVRGAAPELKPTILVILLLCAVAPVIPVLPMTNAARIAGPRERMPTHAAKSAAFSDTTPRHSNAVRFLTVKLNYMQLTP